MMVGRLVVLMVAAVLLVGCVQADPSASEDAGPVGDGLHGATVAEERNCVACHTTDGTDSVGPTWQGLAGGTRTMVDGSAVPVDDAYLRRSIRSPQAQIVDGFTTVEMPTIQLTEGEVEALIDYIGTLSRP